MIESVQGIRICFELGCVAEADLYRLCGATGKSLGLKSVTMAPEQRTITTSGFVISLRNESNVGALIIRIGFWNRLQLS